MLIPLWFTCDYCVWCIQGFVHTLPTQLFVEVLNSWSVNWLMQEEQKWMHLENKGYGHLLHQTHCNCGYEWLSSVYKA
jgi:hypothetical protein